MELEDEYFKYLHPEKYQLLDTLVRGGVEQDGADTVRRECVGYVGGVDEGGRSGPGKDLDFCGYWTY